MAVIQKGNSMNFEMIDEPLSPVDGSYARVDSMAFMPG